MPTADLNNVAVLVTRPSQQGEGLCRAIVRAGGRAVRLPLIEPEALPVDEALLTLRENIGDYHLVIFISPNAVRFGLEWLGDQGIPPSTILAAVGDATLTALNEAGYRSVITSKGASNSEELLKCEALENVRHRQVLIVRGRGGRQLLGDALAARGARVDYAEVYRRRLPDADPHEQIEDWLKADVSICLLTSIEAISGLNNRSRPNDLDQLFRRPLVVLSERMAHAARDAGWRGKIAVCERVDDAGLLHSIKTLIE